jgi:hypothetical protein
MTGKPDGNDKKAAMKGISKYYVERLFKNRPVKRNGNSEKGGEAVHDAMPAESSPAEDVDGENKASERDPRHKENGDNIQQRRLGKIK